MDLLCRSIEAFERRETNNTWRRWQAEQSTREAIATDKGYEETLPGIAFWEQNAAKKSWPVFAERCICCETKDEADFDSWINSSV